MTSSLLLGLLFFTFQNFCVLTQEVKGPPTVEGSYIAVAEATETIDNIKVQFKLDETFDANSGNAALVVYEKGENITFIEDALVKQTFKYSNGKCEVITAEDWVKIPLPPSLMGYRGKDGTIRFSLKQLFNISDTYSVSKDAGLKTTFRGLPALSWRYHMEPVSKDGKSIVDIYSYWSDGTWTTTSSSSSGQVPLGFKIIKLINITTNNKIVEMEQFLNVFSFIHNAVNRKALEPHAGVYCENRSSAFMFPMMSKAKAISFKSEIILPDDMEIKTMDVWYDMQNGLLRVDMDRLDNQNPTFKARRYTSDITSKKLETTYAFDVFKGKVSCKAMNTQNYEVDFQEIINPKLDLKLWNFDTLLHRNSTKWTYNGKTTKRNIPCHLFQGKRNDWPDAASNIESLWEWCVVENISPEAEIMNFRDGDIGLISLQIKFNQSNNPVVSMNEIGTIIHHFYDVKEEDAANLDVSTFDISKCFQPDQQRRLEFSVDLKIDKSNIEMVRNATSDVRFLGAWKNAISDKSKLPLSTLRVAKVKSMVWNNILLVSFTILGVHPDLITDDKQKSPTLEEATKFLNSSVNNDKLTIQYSWSKDQKSETLKALKNTMDEIIKEPNIIPTPTPTSLTSTTTKDKQTTEIPDGTKSPLVGSTSTGHGSGTVAGVSIAMVLLGATMGAGGTFYKYKGMPNYRGFR